MTSRKLAALAAPRASRGRPGGGWCAAEANLRHTSLNKSHCRLYWQRETFPQSLARHDCAKQESYPCIAAASTITYKP
eukprot:6072071-Pleurochrysis_carterae.AAC.1